MVLAVACQVVRCLGLFVILELPVSFVQSAIQYVLEQ
jgi:hypothetical protein